MKKQITVPAKIESFEEARQFIESKLKESRVSEELIGENILVFEEIFVRILENNTVDDGNILIRISKVFGEVKVHVCFAGDRFRIDFDKKDIYNPGSVILSKYEDKIGLKYKSRYNTIRITARRKFDRIGRWSFIGIAAAVGLYLVLHQLLTHDQELAIDDIVCGLEGMFMKAILLIAAPVTLFSLVTNISNVAVMMDDRINLSAVIRKICKASISAIVIAVGFFLLIMQTMGNVTGDLVGRADHISTVDAKNMFFGLVPENALQPFKEVLPFQIILLGVLIAAGICACNTHFNKIKSIFDSVYELCSNVLGIIMLFLPLATFLAFLDMMLENGPYELIFMAVFFIILSLGIIALIVITLIYLRIKGIPVIRYFRKCRPAIFENIRINSPIDAAPYNIRFCNKEFGIKIDKLDFEIPVLAEVSLAGNCFIVMLMSALLYWLAGVTLGPFEFLIMGIIVLGLSIGAPNQSGSILVGLMIMTSFMDMGMSFASMIICCEVFFSRTVSVINVLSDIATVVLDKHLEEKHELNNRRIK